MENRFLLLPRDFSNTPNRELGVFGTEQKKLLSQNIATPKCAIIPLKTLKSIAAANSIPEKISKVLVQTNFNDPVSCTKLKNTISEAIHQAKIPREILQELGEVYHTFFAGESLSIFTANTRTSTTKEAVSGDANVFRKLLQVWAQSTISTLFRSNSRHIHPPLLAHSIVLHEITHPKLQGLLYTRHPKTGVKTSAYIVVGSPHDERGNAPSEHISYEVDIRTWNIIFRPHSAASATPLLDDSRVVQLAKIANTIKKQHLEHKCITWELVRNTIVVSGFKDFYLQNAKDKAQTTITSLYISAGNPQLAPEYVELPIAGIGYLKSEYSLLSLGTHPLAIIKNGRKNLIERTIVRTLETFAQIPTVSHIIYKAFDIPSEELQKLSHATIFENDEQNSWLGVRGAGKALLQPALLETEIHALMSFSQKSNTRISLLLPFVRSASELHRLLRLTEASNLDRSRVETWMHIATLEPLLNIGTYPLEHINGISVQLDTVVHLLLGISPTHAYRSEYMLDPTVLESVLKPFFQTIHESLYSSLPIHIQMEQYDPTLAKVVIKLGADAITVRPAVAPLAKACIIDTEAAPFRASSESSSKAIHI